MSLYSCRAIPSAGYAMAKFDNDLNPEATYEVTNATCTCPAGVRPTCKHRSRLLPAFMKREHIGDGWFLNDANMMWHRPVAETAADSNDEPVVPSQPPEQAERFQGVTYGHSPAMMALEPKPTEATFKRRV